MPLQNIYSAPDMICIMCPRLKYLNSVSTIASPFDLDRRELEHNANRRRFWLGPRRRTSHFAAELAL